MPERTCAECDPCALEVKRRRAREAYYAGQAKRGAKCRGEMVTACCRYCGQEFSHIFRSTVRVSCDECTKRLSGQARAKWAKAHPEAIAAIKVRYRQGNPNYNNADARFRRYGVTAEWYEQQIEHQGGRCANRTCKETSPGGRHNTWHIDHDHVTGQVRGLLCNKCNLAAGFARDDPDVLVGLSKYIRSHRQLRLAI